MREYADDFFVSKKGKRLKHERRLIKKIKEVSLQSIQLKSEWFIKLKSYVGNGSLA